MQILLVEDDPAHTEAVTLAIAGLGAELSSVDDGEKAIDFLLKNEVDLVILDWNLPGVGGIEVVRWIRTHLGARPFVLFFTAKTLETELVQAFEAGADDYVTKPFRRFELIARVNALLRRISSAEDAGKRLVLAHYTVDFNHRVVYLRGEPIALTAKEFDLAAILFRNVGRIISRELIAGLAWGQAYDGMSRAMDTHMSRIRRKLSFSAENGVRLNSVYTHGYRLMLASADVGKPEQSNRREGEI